MDKVLKKQFKDAVRAHNTKSWDEAKDLYQILLNEQPDEKFLKRINKNLQLLESKKRLPGKAGTYALILSITSYFSFELGSAGTLAHVLTPLFFFSFFCAPLFALVALFQPGSGNKLLGVVCMFIMMLLAAHFSGSGRDDYASRGIVSLGIALGADFKFPINKYYNDKKLLPSLAELEKLTPLYRESDSADVRIDESLNIVITYKQSKLSDQTLLLKPTIDGLDLVWKCGGGTLLRKYRPASCR